MLSANVGDRGGHLKATLQATDLLVSLRDELEEEPNEAFPPGKRSAWPFAPPLMGVSSINIS